MKTSADLFFLIKSLTQSEKRHFAMYADKYSGIGKNYFLLFREMEKMEKYDESLILKKFKNYTFVQQLHVTKNYLYRLLLNSLRSYHAGNFIDIKIRNYLQDVEILFNEKALYDQCLKILYKAKKLAAQYEKHVHLLEICEWQYRVFFAMEDMASLKKLMNENFREEESFVYTQLEKRKYQQLHTRFFLTMRAAGTVRDIGSLDLYRRLHSSPLLKDGFNINSVQAVFYFFTMKYLFYDKGGKTGRAYTYARKALETVENRIEIAIDQPTYYVIALNNYLSVSLRIKKYKEFYTALDKMKNLPFTLKRHIRHLDIRVFKIVNYFELLYSISKLDFNLGKKIVENISRGLKEYKGMIDKTTEIRFIYFSSYLFFIFSEYKSAKRWISMLVTDKDDKIQKDIYSYARVLNLLIHYELNDREYINYILRTSKRYIKKRLQLYEVEKVVFNFIEAATKGKIDPAQTRKLLSVMKNELEKLKKGEYEKNVFGYIDVLSWVAAKTKNIKMQEVLAAK